MFDQVVLGFIRFIAFRVLSRDGHCSRHKLACARDNASAARMASLKLSGGEPEASDSLVPLGVRTCWNLC